MAKIVPLPSCKNSKQMVSWGLISRLCLPLLLAVPAGFSQPKPAVKHANGHLKPGDMPHPTAAAPKEMQPLIRDGAVTLVFSSDPEFVKINMGRAEYFLRWTYNYGFTYAKTKLNERWVVKVTASNIEPAIRLEHVIRLPMKYRADLDWNGRLLRHEFDHVAISLDPRSQLLLAYLCRNLPTVERTLAAGEEPTDALCRSLINEEIDRRLNAVDELVAANYALLDQVSKHGTMAIPKRAEFFASLFTKEQLARQRFRFLAEARELFASPAYQQAGPRFLPRDPTEP